MVIRKNIFAYSQRKLAEAALQVSLTEVENYSQALNQELEKGREMQLNFLPGEETIKNFSDKYSWEIASFFKPARQVAGDFYDIFELSHNTVGFVIADVCDKGVGAALFMALFRSLIRIFAAKVQLRGEAPLILEKNLPQAGWIGKSSLTNLAHLKGASQMCKNIICHCEWNEVERRNRKTLRLLHFVRNDNHNLNCAKLGCSPS